jgi:uncharacterized membrane protein YedE/YeeE
MELIIAPIRFNYEVSNGLILVIALLTGICFGFFLEKAGFGNASVLIKQFYFTDMRMLKVLFSAIVTAMIGIFWLSYLRILDITQIFINGTYLWPQILGGILFGFGFVLCGLCPGTSCVAAFTGKLDGLAVMIGMLAGIFIFGETAPSLNKFLDFSYLGDVTIYEVLNMSYGLLVFLIVVFALFAFWLAGKVEELFSKKLS